MDMQDVKSSNIGQVGYDPETETLAVAFKAKDGSVGKPYLYPGVKPEQHTALVSADSIGSHFAQNIRGKFDAVAPAKDEA